MISRSMVPALLLAGLLVNVPSAAEAQERSFEVREQPVPGSRLALVIGNSNYEVGQLRNPVNDARAMAAALREAGFDVIDIYDQDLRGMEEAVRDYGSRLPRAEAGLFYYAGHGIQVDGLNYLVPLGAQIEREPDIRYEAMNADFLLDQLRAAGNPLNMVIFDACRNNPFMQSSRSANRGLASINAPSGTLIAYSTAPGSVAADGDDVNSPYTSELLRHMRTPGLPVELVFKSVRESVLRTTDGRQTPWESSSLTGNFSFFGTAADPQAPTAPPAAGMNPDPTPANELEELVLGYLDNAYEVNLEERGYEPALHRQIGSLAPGGSRDLPVELPSNREIAIFGVCDNECSNMDFELLSEDGRVLDSDTTEDDLPLVVLGTGRPENYYLRVSMPECSLGPCYFAFGVYQRPRGAGSAPVQRSEPPPAGMNPNPTPANGFEELVLNYLNNAYEGNLEPEGYGPALHRQFGTLATGDSVDLPIELPPNTEIAIWGACDNECSNMDLTLLSTKGGILRRDDADDDFPLLIVETGASSRYTLRVAIPACSQGPCYYVFGVYEKTGGGGEVEVPEAAGSNVTPAREDGGG